jgi:hypothetical protein
MGSLYRVEKRGNVFAPNIKVKAFFSPHESHDPPLAPPVSGKPSPMRSIDDPGAASRHTTRAAARFLCVQKNFVLWGPGSTHHSPGFDNLKKRLEIQSCYSFIS